jgi:hypothetical protein
MPESDLQPAGYRAQCSWNPKHEQKKKERDAEIRKVIRVKGKKDEKKETT